MRQSRFAALLLIAVGFFAGGIGVLWGQAGGPFTAPANKVFMGPSVGEAWISRGSGILVQATPSTPPTTTSTTAVMAGVGTNCAFTPKYSTAVEIIFTGNISNTTGTTNGTATTARYGTGTAPANGAAGTGSLLTGANATFNPVTVAGASIPFTISGAATGLLIGTAYWTDLQFFVITAGAGSLSNLYCRVNELP